MKTIATLLAFALLLLFTGLFLTESGGANANPSLEAPSEPEPEKSLPEVKPSSTLSPTITKTPPPKPSPLAESLKSGSFCDFARAMNLANFQDPSTAPFVAEQMNLGTLAKELYALDGPLFIKKNRKFEARELELIWTLRLLGLLHGFPAPQEIPEADRENLAFKSLAELEAADSRNGFFSLVRIQWQQRKSLPVDEKMAEALLRSSYVDHYLSGIFQEVLRAGFSDPKLFVASLHLSWIGMQLPSAYDLPFIELQRTHPRELQAFAREIRRAGDSASQPSIFSHYWAYAFDLGAGILQTQDSNVTFSWDKDKTTGYKPTEKALVDPSAEDCNEEGVRESMREASKWI
jgi:hypothetical protein